MTRLIAPLIGLLLAGAAQASSLSIRDASVISFSGYDAQPASVTGTYSTGWMGTLYAEAEGVFSATYLGEESGYGDGFALYDRPRSALTEGDPIGTTISKQVGVGALGFVFYDQRFGFAANDGSSWKRASFAILDGMCHAGLGCFDFILGFNDSGRGDADFDDFVVGVRLVTQGVTPLSPVPLPAAGWLFGSALVGFMMLSNRRRV